MGTGPGELYQGREGVTAAYAKIFERFDKGALQFETVALAAGSHGDAAWFAATKKISGKFKNETREIGMNLSGTAVREKGGLRFVVLHHSFPKAGQDAE
jgi:ketosteroid isomerase-like protein